MGRIKKNIYEKKKKSIRNQLMKDSDVVMLTDYPHTNKEAWITYRQKLRTLPETWSEGMEFPSPPE